MKAILNNIRRMFVDDGRNNRAFDDHEQRLHDAQRHLLEAADGLKRAASILAEVIRLRH